MSFYIPPGPLIPASGAFSDITTKQFASNSITLSRSNATIISVDSSDTITEINGSQGTIVITFNSSISAGTKSPSTMTFQVGLQGPIITSSSLIFFNMLNTQNCNGIPYPVMVRVLAAFEQIQHGQIIVNLINMDNVNDINIGDVVTMAYMIIN